MLASPLAGGAASPGGASAASPSCSGRAACSRLLPLLAQLQVPDGPAHLAQVQVPLGAVILVGLSLGGVPGCLEHRVREHLVPVRAAQLRQVLLQLKLEGVGQVLADLPHVDVSARLHLEGQPDAWLQGALLPLLLLQAELGSAVVGTSVEELHVRLLSREEGLQARQDRPVAEGEALVRGVVGVCLSDDGPQLVGLDSHAELRALQVPASPAQVLADSVLLLLQLLHLGLVGLAVLERSHLPSDGLQITDYKLAPTLAKGGGAPVSGANLGSMGLPVTSSSPQEKTLPSL